MLDICCLVCHCFIPLPCWLPPLFPCVARCPASSGQPHRVRPVDAPEGSLSVALGPRDALAAFAARYGAGSENVQHLGACDTNFSRV